MAKPKLIRITTVPLSLEKLLEGQLAFMSNHFQVTAVSAEADRLKQYATTEGVSYFYLNLTRKITPFKDLRAVYRLYRFLKKERPSIVHTHTPKAGIVGMMAAYLARVPNRLHTVAGLPLMEASGFKRKLLLFVERLTYRFASKVYPNSDGLQAFIIKEKLCEKEKLQIIGKGSSNGIDTHYFDPKLFSSSSKQKLRKTLGIPQDDKVLLFVGRLVKDKGIVELVDAFKSIYEKYSNTDLLLVGPLESDLDPLPSDTIAHINTHANIHTTGYQQDVRPYFAIADLFIFPSYREGFPNVVMQAGAMGIPAIVSNINGCNEIISENVNGNIIPVKDKDALHASIEFLLNSPKSIENMKNESRKIIQDNYERKEIWNALLAEYNTML